MSCKAAASSLLAAIVAEKARSTRRPSPQIGEQVSSTWTAFNMAFKRKKNDACSVQPRVPASHTTARASESPGNQSEKVLEKSKSQNWTCGSHAWARYQSIYQSINQRLQLRPFNDTILRAAISTEGVSIVTLLIPIARSERVDCRNGLKFRLK